MQVYVQKSVRTTFPRRSAVVSGGELSQPVAPSKPGTWPSTGNEPALRRLPNRLISHRGLRAARDVVHAAATAFRITSVTAWGCEIMITCEPSTSVTAPPARSAIERVTSAPAALSPVATTAHDGRSFHAGGPDVSENASSETGRWVAAINAASCSERSPAKALRAFAGSM